MISKDEIIAVADETGLTPRIVEKDYVLGWLLGAVNANAALSQSCQGRVYYKSYFSSGKLSFPKIKFDLSADEILVLPPSHQEVFHTYTDSPQGGIYINCYVYPEVFGEKIRALGERGRPRDFRKILLYNSF